MPNRWAISSGNWSNTAIWSGSLIPTASDDVWANGFNVFIDQDITVRTLRNHPVTTPVIAQGGSFITTGSRTITCTLTNAGGAGNLGAQGTVYGGFVCYPNGVTSSVLIITGSDNININSDIMGPIGPNIASVLLRNTGIVNITGSIAGYTGWGLGIDQGNAGTVNISGSVRGNYIRIGGGANSNGIIIATNKTINIIGDVIADVGSNSNGITCNGNVNLSIIGNVIARGAFQSITLSTGTSTLAITGSVYQLPTATSTANINIGGTRCDVNISGSVSAGLTGVAINHATAGSSSIQGSISASLGVVGVAFTSATHILTATGPFYNVNNRNAVYAINLQLLSGSTTSWTFDTETALEQRTLYTADFPGNFPSASNVRQGVTFGNIGQFTGVVALPSASNVLLGVPVGNTTGSASFNTQNAWSVATSSLTATGSIGERLRNAATVATDAASIITKGTL
jgi:hypothetical protein